MIINFSWLNLSIKKFSKAKLLRKRTAKEVLFICENWETLCNNKNKFRRKISIKNMIVFFVLFDEQLRFICRTLHRENFITSTKMTAMSMLFLVNIYINDIPHTTLLLHFRKFTIIQYFLSTLKHSHIRCLLLPKLCDIVFRSTQCQ